MADGNDKFSDFSVKPVLVFGVIDFKIIYKIWKFKMADRMADRNAKNLSISAKYRILKSFWGR